MNRQRSRYRVPLAYERIERNVTSDSAITARLGDRWTIVGVTGSGKTTFCKALLSHIRKTYPAARLYIIDSKYKGGDFEQYPGIVRSQIAPDPLRAAGGTLVWQTPLDDRDQYHVFLERILHHGKPAFVYIDELSSLGGRTGQSYPVALAKLLKQGRGLDIGLAVTTQEAHYIPRQVLGMTTHLVRFALQDDQDARKIDRKLRRDNADIGVDPAWYGFLYRRLDGPYRLYTFDSYRQFFGG